MSNLYYQFLRKYLKLSCLSAPGYANWQPLPPPPPHFSYGASPPRFRPPDDYRHSPRPPHSSSVRAFALLSLSSPLPHTHTHTHTHTPHSPSLLKVYCTQKSKEKVGLRGGKISPKGHRKEEKKKKISLFARHKGLYYHKWQ